MPRIALDADPYTHERTGWNKGRRQGDEVIRRQGAAIGGRLFIAGFISVVVLGLVASGLGAPGRLFRAEVLFWVIILAAVELLPVAVSRQLQLSLGFPILLGIAILYPAPVAASIALIGSFDAREVRREITPLKALFNRAQIAASTLVASGVYHWISPIHRSWFVLLIGSLAATVANYCTNSLLVVVAMRLLYKTPIRRSFAQMRLGGFSEFLLNYLGLGFIGVVIAALHDAVGIWSVVAFVLPLVFARQMFFRTMALEEAGKELKDRERVLRALSNRMAEERQDEGMQIAAYLHDDLAQMLFRLNLQVEMAKKRLASGDLESVLKDLDGIVQTKNQTSDAVRALIRDLHRSPIGRKGLSEAIQSFADDISKGSRTSIATDVVEVSLPPPIQLLIYQIAREAAMNALKHAGADSIWISLNERDEGVELQIRDDGEGFDTEAPPPDGHFGSVMMRERALVAGGTFSVQSEIGRGTTITAGFPRVWVEEGTLLESSSQATGGDGGPEIRQPSEAGVKKPGRVFGRFGQEARVRESAGTTATPPPAAPTTAAAMPSRQSNQAEAHPDPDQDQRDRRPVPA
jgi:signal transduction histidine kinase